VGERGVRIWVACGPGWRAPVACPGPKVRWPADRPAGSKIVRPCAGHGYCGSRVAAELSRKATTAGGDQHRVDRILTEEEKAG
jgi:hypothetical protein